MHSHMVVVVSKGQEQGRCPLELCTDGRKETGAHWLVVREENCPELTPDGDRPSAPPYRRGSGGHPLSDLVD